MEFIEIEKKIKEFSKKYGFIENKNNSNTEYVKKINDGFIIKLFFNFEIDSLIIKVIIKEGNDLVPFNVTNTLYIDSLKSFILANALEDVLKQYINLTVMRMIDCIVFDKSKYIIDK